MSAFVEDNAISGEEGFSGGFSRFPDQEFQALVSDRHGADRNALRVLGERVLIGNDAPFSPADGELLLQKAAELGDGNALHDLAIINAIGLIRKPDWDIALNYLGKAAASGHQLAYRQSQLICDAGLDNSKRIEAWLHTVNKREIFSDPLFLAVKSFLPSSFCAHLRERAIDQLRPAKVYDVGMHQLKPDPMRTNATAAFAFIDSDLIMQLVRQRISRVANVAIESLEPPEVLRYRPGEQYKPHIDFFHKSIPHFAEHIRRRGQRIKTALIYLNSNYCCGETFFPKLDIRFRGEEGELMLFSNVRSDGEGDMNTVHAGLPPEQGEKWIFSQWIREKPQPIV
jgi:prolyl 4-hydroxylase